MDWLNDLINIVNEVEDYQNYKENLENRPPETVQTTPKKDTDNSMIILLSVIAFALFVIKK